HTKYLLARQCLRAAAFIPKPVTKNRHRFDSAATTSALERRTVGNVSGIPGHKRRAMLTKRTNRRSFLKKGMKAAGAATIGAGILTAGPAGIARERFDFDDG